ncbi:hypothetical protein WDJ50_18665 (plasmid) [Deinococcus sp. VB142]|uniref:DUF3168 domain-containing protein n=1 Tax=Deinococcus sp. VB142 TaxID=3112952 RepID=A0AAU6Q832_9DEIO
MNILQLLNTLPALQVTNGRNPVFDGVPASPPLGYYAVVSTPSDAVVRESFTDVNGKVAQDRLDTTLITLYGPERGELADLRAVWRQVQGLRPTLTLDGLPVAGVSGGGNDLPVRRGPDGRPWGAVRLSLKYRTGV